MTTAWASDEVDYNALLEQIASESDGERLEGLINQFLEGTEKISKAIAVGLCRDFRANRETWLPEFWQLTRIAGDLLLREVNEGVITADEIGSWRRLLSFRSRSAVTRFIDSSSGFNVASGMVGTKRRRHELERVRAALIAEWEREPTDQEVVDETERRMRNRRGSHREGTYTIADLRADQTATDIDSIRETPAEVNESEVIALEIDRIAVVKECIEACRAQSEFLGQIAELWFGPALLRSDEYDGHPTSAEIARELGTALSTTRTKLKAVRMISQQVVAVRLLGGDGEVGLDSPPPPPPAA